MSKSTSKEKFIHLLHKAITPAKSSLRIVRGTKRGKSSGKKTRRGKTASA